MYLVEIEPGREQHYPSVETLTAAIRGGVIGPQSRIFHRASSSWISITLHPEYRKVMASVQDALPPLRRTEWTFFGTKPASRETVETVEVSGTPKPADQPAPVARVFRALFASGRRVKSSGADVD